MRMSNIISTYRFLTPRAVECQQTEEYLIKEEKQQMSDKESLARNHNNKFVVKMLYSNKFH